jgi:ANTAR domain-containing protein/GAF domain-containing protein
MAPNRSDAVWEHLVRHAALTDSAVTIADVCAVAAASVTLGGAWVALALNGEPDIVICVTDPQAERIAEFQLTLGEGPCHDVLTSAAPVLVADLDDPESGRRWPAFIPEARRLGAAAIFAFPLIIGSIQAGIMGLYLRTAGPLSREQLGDLLTLADVATLLLLDAVDGQAAAPEGTTLNGQSPDLALHRAEIDQATGMLTEQLGVPIAAAFARLRAYAYSENRRLADVAGDIVARRLHLHRDPEHDGVQ